MLEDYLAERVRHEALPCPARGLELVVYPLATARSGGGEAGEWAAEEPVVRAARAGAELERAAVERFLGAALARLDGAPGQA